MNYHRERFRKLTFRALALRRSEWLRLVQAIVTCLGDKFVFMGEVPIYSVLISKLALISIKDTFFIQLKYSSRVGSSMSKKRRFDYRKDR